jgi:hypothetical protein
MDALTIASRLTPAERAEIVRRFTLANPHWRGAEAADILEALYDSDSNLDRTEPFFEAHPDLIIDGAGIAARALIWCGREVTADGMRALLGFQEGSINA